MHDVGIESLNVYLPQYSLALDELASARGVDPLKYRQGLGLDTMAIAPPWEDAVTLAANAAAPLFERGLVSPGEIGLLLVATESAVDHAKPVSIFVHELVRAHPACRTYELKHACYGGTAALMTAVQWIASGAARGRKALVVATDIARYDLASPGEPTQGAGAVAMVVSDMPWQIAVDFRRSGSFAEGVFDFWRPLDRHEALVDGQYSVECYLKALEGAFDDFERAGGDERARRIPWEIAAAHGPLGDAEEDDARSQGAVTDRFAAFLYHVPFPKMAWKAHRRLLEADARRRGETLDDATLDARARATFATSVEPYLAGCRAVGNSYTASLYFCLATLLERHGEEHRGETVALFSYGSGCCAEFFSGHVGAGAGSESASLERLLEVRQPISVAAYEAMRTENGGAPEPRDDFRGHFYYAGTERDRRRYLPAR